MLRHIIENDDRKNISFLVTAPDYKTMAQSARVTFDKVFHNMGEMREGLGEFTLHDGRKIFLRTVVKNPWSVEGLPNCAFCWADEAGLYPRAAWVNIQSRLAIMAGKIILTTTPYGMPWFTKEIVNASKDSDVAYERWSSKDNPAFPDEEYERMRGKLSAKEFQRKFEGIDNKLEGLIFDDFGENNWCDLFEMPHGTQYYGGIDWGYDHPGAIVVRAFPKDGKCYTISIFKRSGLSTTQMVELIKSKQQMFGVRHWFCGHDRPDVISDLNMAGIRASNYFDGDPEMRLVNAGNQAHNELIRTGKYKVFRKIDQWEDLEDEYLSYSWKKKTMEDVSAVEKPNDINDDLMAAERYCTVGTQHLMKEEPVELKIPLNIPYTVDSWDPTQEEDTRGSYEDY